jgi:capsular exopolysaccharide synthesis family protein
MLTGNRASQISEAYRHLRTSVLLSTAGGAPKSLLISSSLPAEGKTTTAVNTAISLAQTGVSVVVVDADMRRPRLHKIFEKNNEQGLSTILSRKMKENEILNLVQQHPGTDLYILPSGPIPPNPAELIGSEEMRRLINILTNHFSHVVVDSPPIASFTDSVLISAMVDGTLLVVQAGKTSMSVVKRTKQILQDVGSRIFGVVLNNMNFQTSEYYYYQRYYSFYYDRDDD